MDDQARRTEKLLEENRMLWKSLKKISPRNSPRNSPRKNHFKKYDFDQMDQVVKNYKLQTTKIINIATPEESNSPKPIMRHSSLRSMSQPTSVKKRVSFGNLQVAVV